jgi:hypothetical protein
VTDERKRRRVIWYLLLLLIVLLLLLLGLAVLSPTPTPTCTPTPTPTPTYKATINVVDEKEHPIEGAAVHVNGLTLTTGMNGKVTPDLPAGDFPVVASHIGYQDGTATLSVDAHGHNSVTVVLHTVQV